MTTENTEIGPVIRQELVETATKFLQNPNVQKTSLNEQQYFLKRKGLTDKEIQLACEKSGAYSYHEQKFITPPPTLINGSVIPYYSSQLTLFDRIREIIQNFAYFSFVAYIIYKFYEKFIAPFLFGTKKKSLEDSIKDLDKDVKTAIDDIRYNIATVKIDIEKISQGSENNTQRQLSDLKSEISTVKGLLLSRNQFPPVSKSPVVRPSIPEWQKISNESDPDSDPDPERKHEDLMEICSGSGSEHNTKTSESSLEIISYSSKDSDFHHRKSKMNDDDNDNDNDNEEK